MGGTFDPVHLGHLLAAEAARHHFELDRVCFVPAARAPHKMALEPSDGFQRLTMILLATLNHPDFVVSDLELRRPPPSYTLDTLRQLREQHPGVDLYFITGADALLEILSWRAPGELLRLAEFVGVTRPGYDLGRIEAVRAALGAEAASRLHVLRMPGVDVSSTEIRRRVRAGESIRYLVPDGVLAYITKAGLYR